MPWVNCLLKPKSIAMSTKRERKFIINMLVGLLLTTTGICSILYACLTIRNEKDWISWAIISVVTINAGLLFLGSSIVHKVKADLIRRQRQRSKADHLSSGDN
jgi:predicted membrane channel-forming protein YqfA (hemolysin III family)